MSSARDPAAAAIDDARALIDALLEHGWHETHVADGQTEIFVAREGGGPNPMRAPSDVPADDAGTPSERLVPVTAPHVATVAWIAQAGAIVAAGDVVARIEVLGEHEEIAAPTAGRVTAGAAEIGTLIEYGDDLLSIAASDR